MESSKKITRRIFVKNVSLITCAGLVPGIMLPACNKTPGPEMKLGLVTYLWGKDWDIPTIIKNCTDSGILGVELRVDHAHGVMPNLSKPERQEVKKIFDNSPVEIVGLGTNQQYDYPDPLQLKESIAKTKEFIHLSVDVGGSGVKVKPNQFHEGVPNEKTIEQIGRSLNELGNYAADYGQQIRLEVHGRETQELPNIKAIMDYVDSSGTKVCWNCNHTDLIGEGLKYNFDLVKSNFGDTIHVRELNDPEYPYSELIALLKGIDYAGWVLLECRTNPEDKVAALIEQREIFEEMISIR